jgi:hypothetical protein
MPGLKHIHRYVKTTLGRNKWPIYKCNLPDCSHYISAELIDGKFSICHRCGERFIITKALTRLAKPHCLKCTEREIKPETKAFVDNLLEDLLGSQFSDQIAKFDGKSLDLDDEGED